MPLFVRIVIIVAIIGLLISLGMGMYYMLNDHGPKKRTVNALTARVAISFGLILFLAAAYFFGWIQPHAGPLG